MGGDVELADLSTHEHNMIREERERCVWCFGYTTRRLLAIPRTWRRRRMYASARSLFIRPSKSHLFCLVEINSTAPQATLHTAKVTFHNATHAP